MSRYKKEVAQPSSSSEDSGDTSSSEHHDDGEDVSSEECEENIKGQSKSMGKEGDDGNSSLDNDSSDEDTTNSNNVPAPISKSWTTLTTHSPCYTGGKVVFSSSTNEDNQPHFILAQRGGDVSVIEAATGLLVRTLRRGTAYQGSGEAENEEDDDDEEMMDADAITAFDLSPNNKDVVVVTRGHLVRRYSLVEGGTLTDENKQSESSSDKKKHTETLLSGTVTSLTNPAPIIQTLGKSGHKLPVTKIAHHPSGIFFATGSVDGLVKIWDSRNGYATHAFHPVGGGKGRYAVTCLQWRQIATLLVLAVGREDGSITVHDLLLQDQEGKKANLPMVVMRDHVSAVTCVAWSEVRGGKVESSSKKHGGGLFFSSGRDSVINTWLITEEDVMTPPRKKKKVQDGAGNGVATKVSYVRIKTLPVYEQVESLVPLSRQFRPAAESKGQHMVLDKKDIVLATIGTKGVVRLWKAFPTGKEGVHSISDLSLLASQNESDAFGEDKGGYTSLHLTSLSTTHLSPLLVAVDAEHNMTFIRMSWATDAHEEDLLQLSIDRAIVGDNGEILDMAVIPKISNDKHTIAVATNSSQVRIFELADAIKDEIGEDNAKNQDSHSSLSPRGLLDGHNAIVLAIDASPCGRYLATAGKDKTMRLWHIKSQKCIGKATGHTEAVGSVALSKKVGCYDVGGKAAENGAGAFVVTASKDRTLKIWPLLGSAMLNKCATNGEELQLRARRSARAHEKDINIVSIAPNDSIIATGSQDKTVKLWRSTDLALQGTLKGHKRGIWDCQFSRADRVLATASGDKTVKLWSIADCSCVRTFQGHMAGVLRVRFLATGLQLLSCGSDGLIKLWTIRTNDCETTIDAHDDKIWAFDLSPCGTALFSGGADSKIAVWRDTTKENDDVVREAKEKNILMEQKLSNHLRNKQYEEALEMALKLEKPNQVLRVLTEIVEKDTKSNRGIETLQKHAVNWDLERLTQILKYSREWNTRARNSHIAMMVVKAIVTTTPSTKLSTMDGIADILGGIAPYAERHFDRLDRMVENSYLLDFTLFSMGSLHGSDEEKYSDWMKRSKYVLPPQAVDGRIQVGGSLLVGACEKRLSAKSDDSSDESVVTIGESSSDSSDEDENSSSSN